MRTRSSLPLILLLAAACGARTEARPADAPPPVLYRAVQVCVVRHGVLTRVTARQHLVTGDTSFGTPDWPRARDHDFAAEKTWYTQNERIRLENRLFKKFGYPRVLEVGEVVLAGEYDGVPVFVEQGDALSTTEVVYLPVRRGCEFQPYDGSLDVRLDDEPDPSGKAPRVECDERSSAALDLRDASGLPQVVAG